MSANKLVAGVIFNPHARKNRRTPRNVRRMRKALGGRGMVVATNTVDDIAHALRTFDDNGIRTIISDGGDGATHWALNMAIEEFGLQRVQKEFTFAPSAGGTIDFIARALDLSGRPDRIAERIASFAAGQRDGEIRELRSLKTTLTYDDGREDIRYAYGSAVAGYAANFYGPFYASHRFRGPVRIVGLLAYGFGCAALASAIPESMGHRKPHFVHQAEYDYLRPLVGEVEVDGRRLEGGGPAGNEFNLLQCGAVHVNLGDVLRVFDEAGDEHFHAHAGHLGTAELFPEVLRAAAGRRIAAEHVHDGATRRIYARSTSAETMTPCLDGELFEGVREIVIERGPRFKFRRA